MFLGVQCVLLTQWQLLLNYQELAITLAFLRLDNMMAGDCLQVEHRVVQVLVLIHAHALGLQHLIGHPRDRTHIVNLGRVLVESQILRDRDDRPRLLRQRLIFAEVKQVPLLEVKI